MYILLIILGTILIGLNYKIIKKENQSFKKEMEFAESTTSEVDEKLIEIRSEFAITITELQREISNLKEKNVALTEKQKYNNNKSEYYENIQNEVSEENDYLKYLINNASEVRDNLEINTKVKVVSETKQEKNSNSLKVDEVKELLLKGVEDDEIAQRLNIGKGEVLLIKELYLK